MQICLSLVCFSILTSLAFGAEYHVDQSSTATPQTGSASNPFVTIAQASAVMSAGDTCYIHRGVYRETIFPQASGTASAPIRYTAFEDDEVVISGTTPVTGWQVHSGTIYKAGNAGLSLGKSNMVYFNHDAQQLARWPNDTDNDPYTLDALFIDTTAGSYSDSFITHPSIPDYWADGGVMHWLGAHSGCAVQRAVTGFDPVTNRLSFTPFPNYWPFNTHSPTRFLNGHRGQFFLLNHLQALDSEREWFYDEVADTLYFYAEGGVDPSTGNIEVATRARTLDVNRNHIHFENLNLFGASVWITGSHNRLFNLRIRHCVAGLITDEDSSIAGGSAVAIWGDDNEISHCLIEEGSAIGVTVGGSAERVRLENNVIKNFNTIGNHTSPFRSNGPDNLVFRNDFSGSARDVTRATGSGSIFAYNEVSDGLRSSTDGGLFYVTGNSTPINIELRHNWFYNAHSPPSYTASKATGIYLDNNSSGYKVHHNVVWDTQWGGLIFNWNALQNEVYNNSFWDVGSNQPLIISWVPFVNGVRSDVRDNILINNLSDVRTWWQSGDGGYVEDEMLDNTFNNNVQVASSPFVSLPDEDFRPQAGSSIIDQGINIAGITSNAVGAAPDVGAYEFGAHRWIPGANWQPTDFDWSLPDFPSTSASQLTANFFNPRLTQIFGTPSSGTIEFRSDGPNTGGLPSVASPSPWIADFEWSGLDLDNVGGANDSIYFSLKVSGSTDGFASTTNIRATDTGWGVTDAILDPGESLCFEITDVSVSSGTFGMVVFDGFSGARFIKTTPQNTGVAAAGTVNGQAVSFSPSDIRYLNRGISFTDFVEKVVLTTTLQDGINLAARDFSLEFSYVPAEPTPATSAKLIADNFHPQTGGVLPLLTGGASSGTIIYDTNGANSSTIPTVPQLGAVSTDFVWTGLDLDNIGNADDEVYFTLVATSASGEAIQADDIGWGASDASLDLGERITYHIENVRLGAGTLGSIEFDGFTGGRLVNRDNSAGTSATASVNGVQVSWTGTGIANTFLTKGLEASALVSQLSFTTTSASGLTLAVQDFDFQFSYRPPQSIDTYEEWRIRQGLADSQGLAHLDLDGDGRSNFAEYAMLTHPQQRDDQSAFPHLAPGTSSMDFTYRMRSTASDINYELQVSETLTDSDWRAVNTAPKAINMIIAGVQEVIHEISTAGSDERFIRMKIEKQ